MFLVSISGRFHCRFVSLTKIIPCKDSFDFVLSISDYTPACISSRKTKDAGHCAGRDMARCAVVYCTFSYYAVIIERSENRKMIHEEGDTHHAGFGLDPKSGRND